ncbi:MAG: CZB domain-containing protein [Candidatus Omnitrophica bacterium]|nr:CZB domain-containing protein [Candidatus Omnitrophota bacterium]MBU1925834.1 CZB domain-containing protein [Candidatus Omnitrophota bacterium]
MKQDDFHKAGVLHLFLEKRLRSFLDGRSELSQEGVVSQTACDLGKWLYSEGIMKFGALPEVKRLEKVHANLHIAITKTLDSKRAGNNEDAEYEYKKIRHLNKEMIVLLTSVALKIN